MTNLTFTLFSDGVLILGKCLVLVIQVGLGAIRKCVRVQKERRIRNTHIHRIRQEVRADVVNWYDATSSVLFLSSEQTPLINQNVPFTWAKVWSQNTPPHYSGPDVFYQPRKTSPSFAHQCILHTVSADPYAPCDWAESVFLIPFERRENIVTPCLKFCLLPLSNLSQSSSRVLQTLSSLHKFYP